MPIPSVAAAQAHLRHVIALLRISGAAADALCADELEQCLALMDGGIAAKEALFRVGAACHPKALGDRFIPGMTIFEWQAELDLLERRCAEAFHELEQSGTRPGAPPPR